ncbi:hypothetical protein TNIN_74101 [Trichonephila inaurata madagascariensis]|uniref:Uncharacterized protein n=1 Tax=Trichonephila inaurata madagascariensis TaxID=2747483 RepID=A0A8X6XM97_9ARAC|nr:hypothetical protein TNIN_74101 [Trichonephila inaurata madagascariensis]
MAARAGGSVRCLAVSAQSSPPPQNFEVQQNFYCRQQEKPEDSMAEVACEAVDENVGKRTLLLLLMVAGRSEFFFEEWRGRQVTSADAGRDGDSKAFYFYCREQCVYGDYCSVELECIGHVMKEWDTSEAKTFDGKPLCGKNRLTEAEIDRLQAYYSSSHPGLLAFSVKDMNKPYISNIFYQAIDR